LRFFRERKELKDFLDPIPGPIQSKSFTNFELSKLGRLVNPKLQIKKSEQINKKWERESVVSERASAQWR